MAKGNRKRVLILFLGGSTVDSRGRVGDTVLKEKDVEPWMEQMSEMNLIAETEGVFVASGLTSVGIPEWQQAAEVVRQSYDRFDGFVIIHQVETIRAAAAACTLMFSRLGKPVVLVGSQLVSEKERAAGLVGAPIQYSGETGARASIINAVQVAISDLGEVVVLFGSHLFRGYSIHRKVIDNHWRIDGEILGKIDFGIRLFGKQKKRSAEPLRVQSAFDTGVAVFEYLPAQNIAQLKAMTKGAGGIFLYAQEVSAFLQPTVAALTKTFPTTKPIVIHTPNAAALVKGNNIYHMWGPTRTAAILRFMWALGQTHDLKKLRTMLKPYPILMK